MGNTVTTTDVRDLAKQGRVSDLAEVLQTAPDRLIRYAAAEALAGEQSEAAEGALRHALRVDADTAVRARAARSLPGAATDPDAALETLLELLTDSEVAMRVAAIRGLEKLQDGRVVPHLEELLGDPAFAVRLEALTTLADVDAPTARRAVERARRDPNLAIRAYAWGFGAVWRRILRKRRVAG